MSFVEELLALVGRQSLNPQPIPPESPVSLNPQPIPPEEYGALMAHEILRLHWQSGLLGVTPKPVSDWEDDPCPVGKRPPLPPWIPPLPNPEPGPEWSTAYALGLASTLAAARDGSEFVGDALQHTTKALERMLG